MEPSPRTGYPPWGQRTTTKPFEGAPSLAVKTVTTLINASVEAAVFWATVSRAFACLFYRQCDSVFCHMNKDWDLVGRSNFIVPSLVLFVDGSITNQDIVV